MVINLVSVTDNSFDPQVLKCDIPVLAYFGASRLARGQDLRPILQEIAAEHSAQVKVVNVEIEAASEIAAKYQVLAVPALILFKNAQEVARLNGPQSKDAILNAIRPFFDQ